MKVSLKSTQNKFPLNVKNVEFKKFFLKSIKFGNGNNSVKFA